MVEKSVLYTSKDHTGYITLNNPGSSNRLNQVMVQELAEICELINGDPDIYVAVLTGSGENFCTGGEIKHLESFGSGEEVPGTMSAAEALASIDRPVLGAINGAAIGEGLELALSCDIRIASDTSKFGLPQITEGRIPVDGGTQRLSRVVGKGKALELVLTGDIIDAREAFEIGLINKLVSRNSLMIEVEAIAKTLAGKAPLAMRYIKEAVNEGLDLTLNQGLRLEADLYFLLHTTADRTEGITSFLQKRKPEYKGK